MKRIILFFSKSGKCNFLTLKYGNTDLLKFREHLKNFKSQLKGSVKTCSLHTSMFSKQSNRVGSIDLFKLITFQISLCPPVEIKRLNLDLG